MRQELVRCILAAAALALGGIGCGDKSFASADGGPDGGLPTDVATDTGEDGDGTGSETDSEVATSSDTLPDTDSSTTTDTDSGCGGNDFPITSVPVDMLIVLDRSNSMCNQGLWPQMGEALVSVTTDLADRIQFGLMLFPALSCAGADNQCAAPTDVTIAFDDPDPVGGIAATVDETTGVGCCGGTPSTGALAAAKGYLDGVSDEAQKYVLLATDGAPNCNATLTYPCDCVSDNCDLSALNCLDDDEAIAAATATAAAGYPVYVLGVGDSLDWQEVMDGIAAGGDTTQYYPAESSIELLDALEAIAAAVITCEFDIDWDNLPEGASADPGLVNFYADGEVIPYDEDCLDGAGWDWLDADTVIFCEEACNALKDHTWGTVSSSFGCDSVVVR